MSQDYRPPEKNAWLALRDIALIVPRIFRYLWEVAPALLSIQCVLMFVTAVIPAAIVWMTKVIIDAVVGAAGDEMAWTAVFIPVAVIFALWILQALCDAVSGFTNHIFSEKVWYSAYQRILDKAGALDVAFYETPRFYDQLHHANQQIHRMSAISYASMGLIQQSFSLMAMVSLLLVLHPLAIVVLIATALPRIFMEGHVARKRFDLNAELIRNDRLIDYMKRLLTDRDSVKEIRTFRLRDLFVSRFQRYRDIYITKLRRLLLHFLRLNMALNLLSLAGVASIWAYAVFQAVLARITVGDLALVFQAAQNSRASLAALISSGGQVYENALFATRFFDLMDLDPQSIEGALSPPGTQTPARLPRAIKRGIELRDVSFKYPASDARILERVSFTIPAGKKTAIVGENGAGKTTLVKLLCRLYDPSEGSVLLDGRDLRDYDLRDYRRSVSVVYQDFFRYDMSASDNVGLGQVEAIDERARRGAAAQKAGAPPHQQKQPNGDETILGKTFDEGVDLSGGEWQHLAIARAFMSDAQILILDEPTATIDAFREHRLYEQFAQMARDKTVVFISHRFSTVRMADVIVVIENGQAIEVGSHEELLARDGKYAAMFSTQAARYR
ncbi:MAG: ABC transporter ATP-binding protein [Gammaproteobacteria bacterium]|nr:ABC transporter ATP-binding protein [Gammaproteobacteria bacterium]